MKRARGSVNKAAEPPATKRSHKGPAKAGAGDTGELGVTEAQLDKIAERVGQQLAKSVAAEVRSALAGAGPNTAPPVPNSTSTMGPMGPTAPPAEVNPLPAPRDREAAETAVHALVYGESNPNTITTVCTSSTPLAYYVSDKLQQKIKSGKYVDLKHLLPGNNDSSYTLRLDSGRGDPAVHLASTTPSKPIPNMDAWLSAFTAFQFIYLQAHPTTAPELLKYMDTVRDIHQRFAFASARFYDENFRLLRERMPELSFGNTHTELWLKAATLQPLSRPTNHPFLRQSGSPGPRSGVANTSIGTCYEFNSRDNRCVSSPCQYRHACSHCQGPHPQFKCRSGPQATQAPGQLTGEP